MCSTQQRVHADSTRVGNARVKLSVASQLGAFGEAIYATRTGLRLSQSAVASSAKLSASYYSQIENCKRLPPPHATALRIAHSLGLRGDDAERLANLADTERAAAILDSHLPPMVRDLIGMIRSAAPLLRPDFVEALEAQIREVRM